MHPFHNTIRRLLLPGAALASAAVLTFPLVAQEKVEQPAASPNPTVSPLVAEARRREAESYRPRPIPDRVILTWQGDPARSQAVTWRTDSSVATAAAQIAVADADPAFVKTARTVPAKSSPLDTELGSARYHTASFEGLTPDTLYAYRVGDGLVWSEWFQFRTASDRPEPFSFVYFGDAQNNLKSLWSRVVREAHAEAPRAKFIVHAGDLINAANNDAEWGEWHYAGGWVNGMIPSVPTPGNHEYAPAGLRRQLSRNWRPQFALPEHGPAGLEETVFSIDYQGVRIISLNSNERQSDQIAWLEERLRDNPNRWTILTFHHPMFSSARGRDNAALRDLWLPLIQRYRVDLVLTGHDHTYARSNLQTGMNTQSGESGTVFVVSVSGPKMYNLDREPWMQRAAEDTQLFQVISIDGGELKYEARTATGELYDAFELRKRRGARNRLIERTPKGVAERLRPKVSEPLVK